jgi:hypothetical protein
VNSAAPPALRVQGRKICTRPGSFGFLEPCPDRVPTAVARSQLHSEGYLLLRNFLPAAITVEVHRAARSALGHGSSGAPKSKRVLTELAQAPEVRALREDPRVLLWMGQLLDTPARPLDYGWVRTVPPGDGTAPHCDMPYMGRGTDRILTLWVPLMPIDLSNGPLAILPRSHRHPTILDYCRTDADQLSRRPWPRFRHGRRVPEAKFSRSADGCRRELGGRWLTGVFQPGDALLFTAQTLHCSLDNVGTSTRLSVDVRFQPRSAPRDPRWSNPEHADHQNDGAPGARAS